MNTFGQNFPLKIYLNAVTFLSTCVPVSENVFLYLNRSIHVSINMYSIIICIKRWFDSRSKKKKGKKNRKKFKISETINVKYRETESKTESLSEVLAERFERKCQSEIPLAWRGKCFGVSSVNDDSYFLPGFCILCSLRCRDHVEPSK